MNQHLHRLREWMQRLYNAWPAARVLKWSRILSRGCLVASPLIFCAAVALGGYEDREALRLNPDEALYDIPTTGEYILIFAFMLSFLLAASFFVIGGIAKACLFKNLR